MITLELGETSSMTMCINDATNSNLGAGNGSPLVIIHRWKR
jgi:hypothetical protein